MEVAFVGGVCPWQTGRETFAGPQTTRLGRHSFRSPALRSAAIDINVSEVASVRINELGWSALGGDGQTMQTCAGWKVGGNKGDPVVFISDSAVYERKQVAIAIPEEKLVAVPKGLNFKQATVLPFLALQAEIVLHEIDQYFDSYENLRVVVVGSSTNSYLVFRLQEKGAGVSVVTTADPSGHLKQSRIRHINPREESFSECLDGIDLVIDTLSSDFGPDLTNKLVDAGLTRYPKAKYISTALPELRLAIDDGIMAGGAAILRRSLGRAQIEGDVLWKPNEQAIPVIKRAADVVNANLVPLKTVPEAALRFEDLIEAIRFPRDADTGSRFGFERAGSYVDENAEDELTSLESLEETIDDVIDSAAENEIESVDTLRQVVVSKRHKLVVLYVSAPWCRRCAFIRPKFMRISQEMDSSVAMLTLNSETNSDVAEELGVSNVPEFLVYREGKRIPAKIDGNSRDGMRDSITTLLRTS